jgi:hypothetical protein
MDALFISAIIGAIIFPPIILLYVRAKRSRQRDMDQTNKWSDMSYWHEKVHHYEYKH